MTEELREGFEAWASLADLRKDDDIESAYEPVTESGCWIWARSLNEPGGYGILWVDGRQAYAHRYMYKTFVGPIPNGMFVLHKCDIRCCVNPTHLFLGTTAENTKDMMNKGRGRRGHYFGQTHGCAKLNDAQVLAIRSDARTQSVIAEAYGIGQTQVSAIKRRKRWAHLPEVALLETTNA